MYKSPSRMRKELFAANMADTVTHIAKHGCDNRIHHIISRPLGTDSRQHFMRRFSQSDDIHVRGHVAYN